MAATETLREERRVAQKVRGTETSDGQGVRLKQIIGQPALPDLDPFLLLDEFGSDKPEDYRGGFPEHPHRGFETVTYMLAGRMRHGDDKGNSGLLGPGSVQWMTAGSGIVHSEMPEQEAGLMWGFQLWLNLPASAKMTTPRYQDIGPDRIPEVRRENSRVRIIAGRYAGISGPVEAEATQPIYLDVRLEAGGAFHADLPGQHNAFVYVYDGAARVGSGDGQDVARGELGVLTHGATVKAKAGNERSRFLLVAGRPLHEPVSRYGPIVMNTPAEVRRAFEDLRNGTFS